MLSVLGIDTNVLLRYLVRDDPRQSAVATRFIEHTLDRTNPGYIGNIVLCELVWVLESGYGYAREQIAATLQTLFEVDRLRLEMATLAWHALDDYRQGIDFSDALLTLVNEQAGCEASVSFDRRAARMTRVRLLSR